MGKISRGILGGFSGKVANVVGGSWKGIAYMRAMPLSVAQPNTAKQLYQRAAMTGVVEMAVLLLSPIIKPLLDRAALAMSGYNLFVKYNIDIWSELDPKFEAYEDLIISDGKMDSTAIAGVTKVALATTSDVTWADDSGSGYKLATDEVYVVLLNATGELLGFGSAGTIRSAQTVTINLGTNLATDIAHAYMAFRREDGLVVGKTAYTAA